jgi:hypothetical protein
MAMIDKPSDVELSDALIAAFEQMAHGADTHPGRVSSFHITADAASVVLVALVSLRQATLARRNLPALAFMDPAGHA